MPSRCWAMYASSSSRSSVRGGACPGMVGLHSVVEVEAIVNRRSGHLMSTSRRSSDLDARNGWLGRPGVEMARVRPRVDRAARDRLAQLAGVDAVDGAVRRDRVPGLGRHVVRAVLRRLLPAAGRQPAVAARGRRARHVAGGDLHRRARGLLLHAGRLRSGRRATRTPAASDGGCWPPSPSAPRSWPTSSPSTPRCPSPPTTTRTARPTGCSRACTRPTCRPV